MERVQFLFWESTKVLVLIFLALLSAKATGALKPRDGSSGPRWLRAARGALYALIFALVVFGARISGYDFAAESYYWASGGNLQRREMDKAYANAQRAVELRPGILRYWQQLAQVKVIAHQYASVIQDEARLKLLNGGHLDEQDAVRLAASELALGRYDRVIDITTSLLNGRPDYPVPYLLKGQAYLSQKDYDRAAKTFLRVLGLVPTLTPAVDGLAQAYYLAGDTARCWAVLNATEKYPFSPGERKHFQQLEQLYGQ